MAVFPASELPKNGASRPEWRRIAFFMVPCIVVAVVLWLSSRWWEEVFSEELCIMLFAPVVLIWALSFPHIQGPLSKGRADLIYYGLAALAVVFLYIDNEHQRRDLQVVLAKDQLSNLYQKERSVNAALEELRKELTIAEVHRTKLAEEMSRHNEMLAAAKIAASDEFSRRAQANERYCADPETLRCTFRFRDLPSDKDKKLPRIDPCEARRYNCVMGMSSDATVALKSIRDATDVVALANFSVESLTGLSVSVATSSGDISLHAAIVALSSYGKLVSGALRTESRVRAQIEAATRHLENIMGQIVKARAELARLAVREITPDVMKPPLGTSPTEASVPINPVDTLSIGIDRWKLYSSVLAKFVWGYVLIILLGLKIARERFVWFESKNDSGAIALGWLPHRPLRGRRA